jgi:hypothetical protein
MKVIDVEGYTTAEPVHDEDWLDVVRWDVNRYWAERGFHNRDGFLCDFAGDPSCLALGHTPDPETEWDDDDDHPYGWGGNPICPATKYATACTECESDDCEWDGPTDARSFWALFGKATS